MNKPWRELRPTQRRVRTAKNKSKLHERKIAEILNKLFDASSLYAREMGQPGSDVVDHARVLPWTYTETKHWEKFPSLQTIVNDLQEKPKEEMVFFYKANNRPTLVTIELTTFIRIVERLRNGWQSRKAKRIV